MMFVLFIYLISIGYTIAFLWEFQSAYFIFILFFIAVYSARIDIENASGNAQNRIKEASIYPEYDWEKIVCKL